MDGNNSSLSADSFQPEGGGRRPRALLSLSLSLFTV